jgi:hypothetical protein
VQRGAIRWRPCYPDPLWGPLSPYPHQLAPQLPPPTLTYRLAKGWGTGHLWPKVECGDFFSALTPTTLLEWGEVLLGRFT